MPFAPAEPSPVGSRRGSLPPFSPPGPPPLTYPPEGGSPRRAPRQPHSPRLTCRSARLLRLAPRRGAAPLAHPAAAAGEPECPRGGGAARRAFASPPRSPLPPEGAPPFACLRPRLQGGAEVGRRQPLPGERVPTGLPTCPPLQSPAYLPYGPVGPRRASADLRRQFQRALPTGRRLESELFFGGGKLWLDHPEVSMLSPKPGQPCPGLGP